MRPGPVFPSPPGGAGPASLRAVGLYVGVLERVTVLADSRSVQVRRSGTGLGLTPSRQPLVLTDPAPVCDRSTAVLVGEEVLTDKGVTLRADLPVTTPSGAELLVLLPGHWLKMRWVAARRILALVMKFQPLRDLAYEGGVHHSVGGTGLALPVDDPVSKWTPGSLPFPAAVGHNLDTSPDAQRETVIEWKTVVNQPCGHSANYATLSQ